MTVPWNVRLGNASKVTLAASPFATMPHVRFIDAELQQRVGQVGDGDKGTRRFLGGDLDRIAGFSGHRKDGAIEGRFQCGACQVIFGCLESQLGRGNLIFSRCQSGGVQTIVFRQRIQGFLGQFQLRPGQPTGWPARKPPGNR